MRKIEYILINDSMPQASDGKSPKICLNNLGHHYVIDSAGAVINPIPVRQPGRFMVNGSSQSSGAGGTSRCSGAGGTSQSSGAGGIRFKEHGTFTMNQLKKLDACSIGIKYNGKLTDVKLRPQLINLLLDLRSQFPEAKILAKDEYDRYHTKVRDDMNQLRRELSDLP